MCAQEPKSDLFSGRRLLLLALLALSLTLWFLYSRQIWEDFLITLRQAKNAAEGQGLTYNVGSRIHGFTSPLNVLLPLLILELAGPLLPIQVLALYNVVALAASLAGLAFVLRALDSDRRPWALGLFASLLLALNPRLVSFSMNGQEASFTVCFLGLGLLALSRELPNWRLLGLAFAGLLWTRPDHVLLVAGLSGSVLLAPQARTKEGVLTLGKALVLGFLLYLPWLVFTTAYYGSPIPHTIVAKAQYRAHYNAGLPWAEAFTQYLACLGKVLPATFLPAYAEQGKIVRPLLFLFGALSTVCSLLWVLPRAGLLLRRTSLMFLLWLLYLAWVEFKGQAFPWYFAPTGLMAALLLPEFLHRMVPRTLTSLCLLVGAVLAYETATAAHEMRLRQIYIEDGVRTKIGLWLKEHLQPGERVYLEPIGYIGYYSEATILDYPGLVSDESVRALAKPGMNQWNLIDSLQPEWLVLRAGREVEFTSLLASSFVAYSKVAEFVPPPGALPLALKHESWALRADACFSVYKLGADKAHTQPVQAEVPARTK